MGLICIDVDISGLSGTIVSSINNDFDLQEEGEKNDVSKRVGHNCFSLKEIEYFC